MPVRLDKYDLPTCRPLVISTIKVGNNPIKMIPKNLAGSVILIVMKGNDSARTYIDNFKLTKQKLN